MRRAMFLLKGMWGALPTCECLLVLFVLLVRGHELRT